MNVRTIICNLFQHIYKLLEESLFFHIIIRQSYKLFNSSLPQSLETIIDYTGSKFQVPIKSRVLIHNSQNLNRNPEFGLKLSVIIQQTPQPQCHWEYIVHITQALRTFENGERIPISRFIFRKCVSTVHLYIKLV